MTAYRTTVNLVPPTPLGLLPARWVIEHHCRACRQQVPTDQLIDHAQTHHAAVADPAGDGPRESPATGQPESANCTGRHTP